MQPLLLAATISQKLYQVTVAKLHWMKKSGIPSSLWQKDRTELLDWVAEQDRIKDEAIHDFQDTDQGLALYNQTHRANVALPKEPEFSDLQYFTVFYFFYFILNIQVSHHLQIAKLIKAGGVWTA